MNDKLAYQVALVLCAVNIAIDAYCYHLKAHPFFVVDAGIFLAFAVRSVSELRKMKKRFGVRA